MKKLIVVIVGLAWPGMTLAQVNLKIQTKAPQYINVNTARNNEIYDIRDGFLNIEYLDNIGKTNVILLEIFDWKTERLGRFELDKSPGLNHYSFELADIGIAVETNAVFRCVVTNENKNKYEWTVREGQKPTENTPVPNITVNPIHVGCGNVKEGNLVEFHGDISGGSAPYKLRWYVINEARTGLLYQPKDEKIIDAAIASMIIIDKNPVYNVMLLVTDACGNSGKQMVTVSCRQSDKKIHTLFVEPLEKMDMLQHKGN
jgi:hypothetical protein